jgi:hypothetical protein
MKSEGHGKFLFLATPCEASLNPDELWWGGGLQERDPPKSKDPSISTLSSPPIPALHRDDSSGCVAPGRRRDSTQPRQLTTGLSSIWPCAAQPVNHQTSCGFFPLCNELDAESPAPKLKKLSRGDLSSCSPKRSRSTRTAPPNPIETISTNCHPSPRR